MPSKLRSFKSDPAKRGRGAGQYYRRVDSPGGWAKRDRRLDASRRAFGYNPTIKQGKVGGGAYSHRHDAKSAAIANREKFKNLPANANRTSSKSTVYHYENMGKNPYRTPLPRQMQSKAATRTRKRTIGKKKATKRKTGKRKSSKSKSRKR